MTRLQHQIDPPLSPPALPSSLTQDAYDAFFRICEDAIEELGKPTPGPVRFWRQTIYVDAPDAADTGNASDLTTPEHL